MSEDSRKSKAPTGRPANGHPATGSAGAPLPPKASAASNRAPSVENNQTGRVTFDDRGNAIWEWAVSTGKFGLEVSASRLKKLENSALSLADDGDRLQLSTPPPRDTSHGYSPYDSGPLDKPAAPRKKDLRRLGEWTKLQKKPSGGGSSGR